MTPQRSDRSSRGFWVKIEEAGEWHWQYEPRELTFDIYKYNGQYWKLYRARWATDNGEYEHGYGGQSCRMALVKYKKRTRSPHSNRLMQAGDKEWERTYEVNEAIHKIVPAGKADPKSCRTFLKARALYIAIYKVYWGHRGRDSRAQQRGAPDDLVRNL